jgi:hypothetical protein
MIHRLARCKVDDRNPSETGASKSSNSSILRPDMLAVVHSYERGQGHKITLTKWADCISFDLMVSKQWHSLVRQTEPT